MGPELQISVNNAHQLLVTSPVQFFWWVVYVALAADIVLSLTVAQLAPKAPARGLLLFSPVLVAILLIVTLGWRHTMDINWDKGQIVTEDYFLGQHVTTHAIPTASVHNATVQYARQGSRIALILGDGGIVTPLGSVYLSKQLQYVVVNAVNDGLKGSAAGNSGSATPGSAPRQENSVDRMVREEREFEQRLQEQKQQQGKDGR